MRLFFIAVATAACAISYGFSDAQEIEKEHRD
jgi:hypothetical protein